MFSKVKRWFRLRKISLLISCIVSLILLVLYSTWTNSKLKTEVAETTDALNRSKLTLSITKEELENTFIEVKAERNARIDLYERLTNLTESHGTLEANYRLAFQSYQLRTKELSRLELDYEELLILSEEQRDEILQARCDQSPFDDSYINILNKRMQF